MYSHPCIMSINRAMCSHCAPVCGMRLLPPVPTARKSVQPLSSSCMRQPLLRCHVRLATALQYSKSLPCRDAGWATWHEQLSRAVDMTCHERVMDVSWTQARIYVPCKLLPSPSPTQPLAAPCVLSNTLRGSSRPRGHPADLGIVVRESNEDGQKMKMNRK